VTEPPELRALAEWQSSRRYVETGPFELESRRDGITAWFEGDEEKAARFVPVGENADGSIYAFWRYEGRAQEDAPIAYLDSEGTGNGVVAEEVRELLSLVATGEEPYYWLRGERAPEPLDVSAFRDWLSDELGIEPAADPVAVVRRAQARHPDLEDAIAKWAAVRDSRT
jgi:hypothetical protein